MHKHPDREETKVTDSIRIMGPNGTPVKVNPDKKRFKRSDTPTKKREAHLDHDVEFGGYSWLAGYYTWAWWLEAPVDEFGDPTGEPAAVTEDEIVPDSTLPADVDDEPADEEPDDVESDIGTDTQDYSGPTPSSSDGYSSSGGSDFGGSSSSGSDFGGGGSDGGGGGD